MTCWVLVDWFPCRFLVEQFAFFQIKHHFSLTLIIWDVCSASFSVDTWLRVIFLPLTVVAFLSWLLSVTVRQQTTSKTVILRCSENLEAREKISEFIHPLHSFSCDCFHTNRYVTALGAQGWKWELLGMVTSVVPKVRLGSPSGSSVAAFFGKKRFEMVLKTGYRVRPISRSCKCALLSCRTPLGGSDQQTMSYLCCIHSYKSIQQWNYRKSATKASCKWKSHASWRKRKRGHVPNKCCTVIAMKGCVCLHNKGLISAKLLPYACCYLLQAAASAPRPPHCTVSEGLVSCRTEPG